MVHTESRADTANPPDFRPDPGRCTLAGMVGEWVAATPDSTAVLGERVRMSYRELDTAASGIAEWLGDAGLGVGDCVAIALPVSPDYVVAAVGAAQAGVTYISIDPATPPSRLARTIHATGASALITVDGVRPPDVPPTVATRAATTSPDALPRRTQHSAAGPGDIALVIHTSGTTGTPRAVALEHRSFVDASRQAEIELGPGDRVPLLASVAFDASAFELWATLGRGATLVVPEQRGDVKRVVDQYRVTGMLITSALFRAFVDQGGADVSKDLRWVLVGGEELSAAHAAKFAEAVAGCAVYNCYGPTETTVFATWHRVSPGQDGSSRVPIGRATLGKEIHLLGDDLDAVPDGQIGEIFIRGDGLARGYLGAPAATAQRFVPAPEGPAGSRMYRTGDLGRRLPDGSLVFEGRRDRQLKISGHRVDPTEIEAVLQRHPGVTHAAVEVHTRPNGRPVLCAYVQRSGPDDLQATAVRDWLAGELPPYLVPARIVVLDAMALTTNGKIDRAALPAGWSARSLAEVEYVPPATDAERLLSEVWSDVLGIADVGLHDNFFDLGGDSLTGIELTARVGGIAGFEITARDLIQNQTVGEMAGLLGQRREREGR